MPTLGRWFFASPVGRLVIPGLIRRALFAHGGEVDEERVARMIGHLDAPGGWIATTKMGLAARAPADERLGSIMLPTLICWGRHDRFHPVATAPRLAGALGGPTRVEILEESGHNGHEEQAVEFAGIVLEWLGGLES